MLFYLEDFLVFFEWSHFFRTAAGLGLLSELTLRMVNLTDVELSAVRVCFTQLRALQLNFVCFPLGVWGQLLADCFPGAARQAA